MQAKEILKVFSVVANSCPAHTLANKSTEKLLVEHYHHKLALYGGVSVTMAF